MSITRAETNPNGDDRVVMTDPGTEAGMQEPIPENQDAIDALTHVPGAGAGRDVRRREDYDVRVPGDSDPDAAFSGTHDTPERWVHDEALQVRQLLPTNHFAIAASLSPAPITVVPANSLRMETRILNNDAANTAYIGSTYSNALPGVGYPLLPGKEIVLTSQADIVASCSGASCDLRTLVSVRSDNRGQ